MGKERICIDSCVFFHLMRYNDVFEKEGKSKLIQTIVADELRYKEVVANLEKFMQPLVEAQEKKKHQHFSFEKKLSIVNSLMKNDKINIPSETKDLYKKLYDELAEVKSFSHLGELYIKYLGGGVSFYLTPTAQAEIAYHRSISMNPSNAMSEKERRNSGIFTVPSIDSMIRKCRPIRLSEEEKIYVNKLSEILRGKITIPGLEDVGAAMKDSINRLGVYGDSLIMAESIIAGLPLITQNEKDFIFNKGSYFDKKGNVDPKRRNIIKQIIDALGFSENALPYSVEEFLNNTADAMVLEKVLTMDPETAEIIFGHRKPHEVTSKRRNRLIENTDEGMSL